VGSYKENTVMSERVIEYPFVKEFLNIGDRILDVGTGNSADIVWNYEVKEIYALDKKLVNKPNFISITGNAEDKKLFEKEYFNKITCVSTLEHTEDDKKISENFHYWLKNGGILVLTVPYGKYNFYRVKSLGELMRLYDKQNLLKLFPKDKWEWIEERYYIRKDEDDWEKCDEEKAYKFGGVDPVKSVILLALKKI